MKLLDIFKTSRQQAAGFLVFVGSFLLYLITLSPTLNLWDCGEFIACANGLEVGHAPGAPLYLMLARVFSAFASPEYVAYYINLLSALASAATVWLLYSTLLLILNKVDNNEVYKNSIVSAMIGSLSFAFTDTFWFSAVEGEVYALSLFFTAFTVWAVLKWEMALVDRHAHRWLLLISFTMGLSVGVHLLNLLCIPLVVYWVFIKLKPQLRYKHTLGIFIGFLTLLAIQLLIVQNGLFLAKSMELLLVNYLGLPVHSGLLVFLILLTSLVVVAMVFLPKRSQFVHFVFVALSLFMLGISSYAMVIIRANAQLGINLNNPAHVFSLESFINREQYGERPLLSGPWYGAKRKEVKPTFNYRLNKKGVYELYENGADLIYDSKDINFLQRMYSTQEHHKNGYYFWAGLEQNEQPTLLHQIEYLFKYQVGHMYFRYFMWNFSGRQNHYQGHGDFLNGNFVTGFSFLDQYTLGSRRYIHAKELTSKARNHYFMLPLLFGLAGLLFLVRRKKWSLLIFLASFFVLTGVAIVFYLNQPPFEPRERDYVFVGSFYAFSIFIGIGVWDFLQKIVRLSPAVLTQGIAYVAMFLALPGLLLANNYNDHTRSDRTLARDLAKSYLESCEPHAILFTYGDNDTYPLWYLQEVEGVRRDVNVVNVGLLSADWYIQQLSYCHKSKEPLAFTISQSRYKKGNLDYAAVLDHSPELLDLKQGLRALADTLSSIGFKDKAGNRINYLPAKSFSIGSDSSSTLTISKSYLMKGEIALLDIIATNYHKRPVYFANGTPASSMVGFDQFIQPYGIVSKLSFTKDKVGIEELYEQLSEKINISVPKESWFDESGINAIQLSKLHDATISLGEDLLAKGDTSMAQTILQKFYPISILSYYHNREKDIPWVNTLFKADLKDEALAYLDKTTSSSMQNFNYYIHSHEYLGANMHIYAKEEMQYLKKLHQVAVDIEAEDIAGFIEYSLME